MASAEPARDEPTVLLRLAEGGMADVFVALDRDRNLVVLKKIPAARQESPGLVECLREEARLSARLNHPNVCRLLATTEDDRGEATLVMEYLEGVQLRRLASTSSDLALIAGLLVQAAAGLDHVHEATEADGRPAGIVHRDVNPQNLMVTVAGEVKLLDFGIAKARDTELRTGTGSVKGTPAYLSPEQVRGEPVDRRADVFALGSTAVKLLVGEAPFARENFFATVQAIIGAPLPDLRAQRPELPAALVDVLARALERDRDDRFATAGEFARAFVAALPAEIRPLDAAAIAERIRKQFGFEIDDRRRRIDFAIDQLDSGELPLAPEPRPVRAPTAATQVLPADPPQRRSAPEVSSFVAPPEPVHRPRWRLLALVGVIGVGAAVAALVASRQSASTPDATPPRVASTSASPADASLPERPDVASAGTDAGPGSAAATHDSPSNDAKPEPTIAKPAPPGKPPHGRAPKPPADTKRAQAASTPPSAADTPGFLTVGSTPFATIYIDGVKLGVTPMFRKPVAAGRRKLRAECSCGKTKELTVTIEAGASAPAVKLTW